MEPRFGAKWPRCESTTTRKPRKRPRLSARAHGGEHAVFGAGDQPTGVRPSSIAHELAHVMQSRAGASAAVCCKEDWDFAADYTLRSAGDLKIAADSSLCFEAAGQHSETLRFHSTRAQACCDAGVNLHDLSRSPAVPNNDRG
jgi:hypothetical protein